MSSIPAVKGGSERERRIKNNVPSTATLSLLVVTIFGAVLGAQSSRSSLETFAFESDFASDRPLIYVDPPLTNQSVGSTFTISVRIFNLTDNTKDVVSEPWPLTYSLGNLSGLEFRLSWNSSVLEHMYYNLTMPIEEYPYGVLHGQVDYYRETLNETAGTYDIAVASSPATPFNNPDQSNTILNMTFRVKKAGVSTLKLGGTPPATLVKLATATTEPGIYPLILHEKSDGLIVASGVPPVPTAEFTYTPALPLAGENMTFNASLSAPNIGSITSYVWTFGDGASSTGSLVTHAYSTPENYTATLNVTNSEGSWDTESKLIRILSQRTITQEFMLDGTAFSVDVTSNSTISTILLDASQKSLNFNATGPDGTVGFAEVAVPLSAMWGSWTVLVDDGSPLYLEQSANDTHMIIYLTYNQSARQIVLRAAEIVPEFPLSGGLLVMLIAVTLACCFTFRKRRIVPLLRRAILLN